MELRSQKEQKDYQSRKCIMPKETEIAKILIRLLINQAAKMPLQIMTLKLIYSFNNNCAND